MLPGVGDAPVVAIRVDASTMIGTGHLKRCLSLAHALTELGTAVQLIVRPLDSVTDATLQRLPAGVSVHRLAPPADAGPAFGAASPGSEPLPPCAAWAGVSWERDARETIAAISTSRPTWLVVDHYAFDRRWHRAVRLAADCRLLVIDDTADRAIDADALLDANWSRDHRRKYAGRPAREPLWLTGPAWALLGPTYRHAERWKPGDGDACRSIGVFMGGTDPHGASSMALAACRRAGFQGSVEVVSTRANPRLRELEAVCDVDPDARLTLDHPDLSAFFARHDLQIGAGGGAAWERCCIGAPTVAAVLADNQTDVVRELDALGAVRVATLTPTESFESDLPAAASKVAGASSPPPMSTVIRDLLADLAARMRLSTQARELVDGRGAERVALVLMGDRLTLRPATRDDAARLHAWRDHPATRRVSSDPRPIDFESHRRWLAGVLGASDRHLFVAMVGSLSVGSIRFDREARDRFDVSLYLDPELRGLGLGATMLLRGETVLRRSVAGPIEVHAEVVPGNHASRRLFERCGYDGGPVLYRKRLDGTPTHASIRP